VDTRSTASSSTDAAGSDGPGDDPGSDAPAGSAPPGRDRAADHDPDRRAFFRLFGKQAIQTVTQVAGVASAVSQMPANAMAGLMDLGLGTTPAQSLPPARPAPLPATDAAYRSPYRVTEDALYILDQRRLPDAAEEQLCRRGSDVAFYLRVGAARGGSLMAQLAAYGMALSAHEARERSPESRRAELRRVGRALAMARTGSRMLRWSVDRAWAVVDALPEGTDGPTAAARLRADADARAADAELDHAAIARALEEMLPRPEGGALEVVIHGDPGQLTAGMVGMALTALSNRVAAGGRVRVWVTETRPSMEGARLASWELANAGIDHVVLPDAAVGALLERERVDAVLLGAEWIAANGDTAGIAGSRVVAGMAATTSRGPVPVIVGAPITTFDPATADGTAIPLEDRASRELQTYVTGTRLPRVRGWNPGADVVPATWIASIVTEMGVFAPTDGGRLASALEEREARRPIEVPD
jgi:methylthioribose-1-phosphate isomerase